MPRKTREQKKRAAERKELQVTEVVPVKREFSFSIPDLSQLQNKASLPKRIEKTIHFDIQTQVKRDLAKVIILALSLFGLELVIYFSWLK